MNRAAEVNITSANVHWYEASSLINFHLSRHRAITTMQPRPLQPSQSAGRTFERGISSDDPPEPPYTTLHLPRLRPTRLVSWEAWGLASLVSAILVLFEPCLSHVDHALPGLPVVARLAR